MLSIRLEGPVEEETRKLADKIGIEVEHVVSQAIGVYVTLIEQSMAGKQVIIRSDNGAEAQMDLPDTKPKVTTIVTPETPSWVRWLIGGTISVLLMLIMALCAVLYLVIASH